MYIEIISIVFRGILFKKITMMYEGFKHTSMLNWPYLIKNQLFYTYYNNTYVLCNNNGMYSVRY